MAWVDFRKRIRSANAIITNAERRYGKDSRLVQSVYKSLEEAYGVEGKRRFSIPRDSMDLREIGKIDRALQRVQTSSYFTKEGRERMNKKSRETWAREHADMDVKSFDRFIHAKAELGSLLYGTSEQVINEIEVYGKQITDRQFKNIVRRYAYKMNNHDFSAGDEPEFFEFLYDEVKKLENDKLEKGGKKRIYG